MNNYLSGQKCVFAFNIWDFNSAKAIMDAAASERKPVILQTSAGIYRKMDAQELRRFISTYSRKKNIHVWLHLDHCRDMETIHSAVSSGWDSVMLDASDRPLSENITLTKNVIEEAHGKGVLVEAEVGQIKRTEDKVHVTEAAIADKEEIRYFVRNVKPDMLAVAFGNAHGIYKGNPKLHFELIDYVAGLTDIPFVVHGGSGLDDMVLKKLADTSNVRKINISTEVKMAYRRGIMLSLEQGLLEESGFQAIPVEDKIHDAIWLTAKEKIGLL